MHIVQYSYVEMVKSLRRIALDSTQRGERRPIKWTNLQAMIELNKEDIVVKIEREIKRLGYFWAPDNPNEKLPGMLSISDGGVIELEIVTPLVDKTDELENLRRIVGEIHDEGFVTLDDCSLGFSDITHRGGVVSSSRYRIRANKTFIGVAYGEGETPVFDSLTFSVEGIDEWVGIGGIQINRRYAIDTTLVSYEEPATIVLNLDQGMKLFIEFHLKLPAINKTRNRRDKTDEDIDFEKETTITQKTCFRLISEHSLELYEFTLVVDKIVSLLRFALGEIVCVDTMWATSENPDANIASKMTSGVFTWIYYPSQLYSKDEGGVHQSNMLFGFEEMKDDAESKINKWIQAYDKIAPTFYSYFFAQMGSQIHLEARFLALVQGLEAYHRRTSDETRMPDREFKDLVASLIQLCPEGKQGWLQEKLRYGNEVSLRKRLKKLIEPFKQFFGDKKTRTELINSIVNTRHYLTHYDLSLETEAAKGEKLEVLCLKLESLFQFHLLDLMGFSREVSRSLVENYRPNRRRLKRF